MKNKRFTTVFGVVCLFIILCMPTFTFAKKTLKIGATEPFQTAMGIEAKKEFGSYRIHFQIELSTLDYASGKSLVTVHKDTGFKHGLGHGVRFNDNDVVGEYQEFQRNVNAWIKSFKKKKAGEQKG